MKKWFLFVLFWLALLPAFGASVTLAWDASPSPEVIGYKIYVGPSTRVYTNIVTLSNVLTCTISNLNKGGTYFFTATAYDASGLESDYSNEVSYTVPPIFPGPSSLRPVVAFEERFNRQRTGFFHKLVAVALPGKKVKHVPAVAAAHVFVRNRA